MSDCECYKCFSSWFVSANNGCVSKEALEAAYQSYRIGRDQKLSVSSKLLPPTVSPASIAVYMTKSPFSELVDISFGKSNDLRSEDVQIRRSQYIDEESTVKRCKYV